MSKSKITSKNQSGGITAKNVSFDGGSNQFDVTNNVEGKEKSSKRIFTLTGILALVASILTILSYFNIFPFHKK